MIGEDTLPRAVEEQWYGEPNHDAACEREFRRLYGDPQHDPDPSDGPEALFRPWSADESDDGDDSDGFDGGDRLRRSPTGMFVSSIGFGRAADD